MERRGYLGPAFFYGDNWNWQAAAPLEWAVFSPRLKTPIIHTVYACECQVQPISLTDPGAWLSLQPLTKPSTEGILGL